MFLRKWQFLFQKFNLIFNVFFFVWVLEDLLQRIRDILSTVYKVSVSAK
jgi:hypothetical protein